MRAVAALDVGGTVMKAALMTADGDSVASDRRPTRRDEGPDAVVATIARVTADLLAHAESLGVDVAAIGVVVPGIVDEDAGVARYSANLGWRDVPLRARLSEHVGRPVVLGHDVRAGAIAEQAVGAGRGSRTLLFVPIGTGIGGAVVRDGVADVGSHFCAAEVGHLVVRPDGPPCGCGGRGCVESIASARAIAERYRELVGADATLEAAAVAAAAATGDRAAAKVWDEALAALADGLVAAITMVDPDTIVLGGGLTHAGDALLEPLRRAITARLTFQVAPRVALAELGDEAGCRGAALLAWRSLRPSEVD